MTSVQSEIYLTVIAVLTTSVMLWLRWRKEKEIPADNPSDGVTVPAVVPAVSADDAAVIPVPAPDFPPVVPPDVTTQPPVG